MHAHLFSRACLSRSTAVAGFRFRVSLLPSCVMATGLLSQATLTPCNRCRGRVVGAAMPVRVLAECVEAGLGDES